LSTTILFAFQQHSSCMHQPMVCATQFNSCCTKPSKPYFFWAMVTTGQSWTQSITRFSESTAAWIYVHTYIHKSFLYSVYKFNRVTMRCNMSCTSAKLKKSSSDWLNSGKTAIQHLSKKMWICVLPGSAAALLRWSRKISHCLNACCLSNITVKQYQNLLMYVEVTASQRSVIFGDTCTSAVIHCLLYMADK